MRRLLGLVAAALMLCAGQSFADLQWNGPDTQTDPIGRTGNVGIGTTSPTNPLHLYKAASSMTANGTSTLVLENAGVTALQFLSSSVNSQYIMFSNGSIPRSLDGWIRYTPNTVGTSTYMEFKLNNAVAMTIKGDGKVGIGTTAPAEKLDVSGNIAMQNSSGNNVLSLKGTGDGTTAAEIKLIDATDNKYWIMSRRDNVSGESNNLLFSFYDGSTWYPALNMTPAGNVGIGTATPSQKLAVAGNIVAGNYPMAGAGNLNAYSLELGGDAPTGTNGQATMLLHHHSTIAHQLRYTAGTLYYEAAGNGYGTSTTPTFQANGSFYAAVNGGNVGIGTTTPVEKLSVNGNILITDGDNDAVKIGELGGSAGRFDFGYQGGASATQNMLFQGGDATNEYKMDNFTIQSSIICLTGNVGIGTSNPGTNALAVNGTIKAKEVIVSLDGWSDFVFAEGYKLRSLSEVEQYIKANKRLPDVPSADEVKTNGVSIGDAQAKLLQKVEELTLYMIELKKENQEMRNKIAQLSK